ncbi:hypothetical protein DFH06DRAFT_1348422 [Mycena polygramma]|nr:hypothetical protein DFH06DRAFT_1348422 [Mycena polygramma]
MSHITTAMLGSFSRLFSPSPACALGISHSQRDPDLAQQGDTQFCPASSTGIRPRPASATGYWGWDVEGSRMALRRRTRTGRDVGLVRLHLSLFVCCGEADLVEQAPADVKTTDSSPVLACRPPRPACTALPMADVGVPAGPAALADIINTVALELPDTTAPPHTLDPRDADSSFDFSHSFDISHTSVTSSSSDSDIWSDGDILFVLPPPPADPAASYARQHPDTFERCADSEPDSSFDVSLDASLDISLISDTSTSSASASDESFELGDLFGSFHFALPPPILPSPSHPPSTSPAPPLSNTAPGAALKPIGLGLTNLYKPSGTPFDGMGVLSFGVCSHSPSPKVYAIHPRRTSRVISFLGGALENI